jgi:uncharacterized protein HemX
MDTPKAIATLETLSQNLGAQASKALTQQAAVDVAIAQLKDLLDTPSADLTQARIDLSDAQNRIRQLETPTIDGTAAEATHQGGGGDGY